MRDIYVRIDEETGTLGETVIERPDLTEGQRKQFNFAFAVMTICSTILGMAFWVGICSFFVWAAVGGWRVAHHGVDLIIKAFQ